VGDSPQPPPLLQVVQLYEDRFSHRTFDDDAGKVIRSAMEDMRGSREVYRNLRVRYTYGVRCAIENPNKKVINSCRTPLNDEISRVMADRQLLGKTGPLVIIACGTNALKSLGMNVQSFDEAQGRVYDIKVNGHDVSIVVTMSMKAVAAAPGRYSALLADLERAFRIAVNESIPLIPRSVLEAKYRYPRTNAEVRDLVDEIIAYSDNKTKPVDWALAVDTETNTLHPHRDGLRLLIASVAWDDGLAAAIVLWHPKVGEKDGWVAEDYDPDQAWEDVKRLFGCAKPKILHNAGYDLKVAWKKDFDIHNIIWDSMLAEHALEEDKKGLYGLKFLVKMFLPGYAGYEDKLRDLLESEEGEDQTVSILKDEARAAAAPTELAIPAFVKAALDKLKLTPKFRVETLQKRLDDWRMMLLDKPYDLIEAAELVLQAKAAGEFNKTAKKAKKKEDVGGYEKIELSELCFYGCVDADVCRQLAILQRKRMFAEDAKIAKDREDQRRYSSSSRRGPQRQMDILCNHPHPLVPFVKERYIPRMRALGRVEYLGIKVDREYMAEADGQLEKAIREAQTAIYELAGEEFNINSGPQLAGVLTSAGRGFIHPDKAKVEELIRDYPKKVSSVNGRILYEPISKTKHGAIQTTEKVLKTFTQIYGCPMSNLVLAFRKATKARGTFLKNVDILSRLDGMLHTRYNLHGTGTGRLSSANLNMQNVPKGKLGGVICKKLFIPDDDSMVFVNADAKGAEIGIFSAYSRDASLIAALLPSDAYPSGMDAHCFFASKCLNPNNVGAGLQGLARKLALEKAGIDDEHAWSYEDFLLGKDGLLADKAYGKRLKALRDNIKRVVFGILFGAGAGKIAEIAGIDYAFAKTIIDLLFGMFPTIPNFRDQTKWELDRFGFVETYFGRRRRFSIKNAPRSMISQAQRRAVNFKIQSTNSDIVLDVLTDLEGPLRDMGGRILLTVHDSIGFQIPKKYLSQVPDLLKEYGTTRVARSCPWLPVPYKWDIEAGPSYGEVIGIQEYLKLYEEELRQNTLATEAYEGYTEDEMYEDLRNAVFPEEEEA
jgi:DNA polymerase I-like protein with 3'-5' exonuclease and polymerase domains